MPKTLQASGAQYKHPPKKRARLRLTQPGPLYGSSVIVQ